MIFVILLVLGLVFGSFVNALVWRLHEQDKHKAENPELSITKGRSMCPDCKHMLAWYDLLPVISWLSLGGKCRYCKKPISVQYPLVESTTAVLFVGSYVWWPFAWNTAGWLHFVVWLVVVVILMSLLVYDVRWMLLPNKLVYPLIGLVFAQLLAVVIINKNLHPLISAFWGVVCLAGLFYLLFQVSRGKWIGGGDVKLAVALGILVGGPIAALVLLFIASLLGCIVSIPQLIKHKKKYTSRVPFGPFLIIATLIVYIFGTALISWYKKQILLL